MRKTLLFALILVSSVLNAQTQYPETIIGNWINKTSNNWDIGFFEKFAIYNCDFWDYKTVTKTNGGYDILIQNGKKKANVKVVIKTDSTASIAFAQKKREDYMLMKDKYPPYTQPDTRSFPKPVFKEDSATIIGYCRNFDRAPSVFLDKNGMKSFCVTLFDIVQNKSIDYSSTTDSLGRFKIKIPIINTQPMFRQYWGGEIILQPGDKLFFFGDWHSGTNRLYMGASARVNNEMEPYRDLLATIPGMNAKTTDLQALDSAKNVYGKKLQHLNNYIEKNPTVSKRFKTYQYTKLKYELGCRLMQNHFNLPQEHPVFHDEYIKYVNENFSLENKLDYTLAGYKILTFLIDRIEYEAKAKGKLTFSQDEAIDSLDRRRWKLADEFMALKNEYIKLRIAGNDTLTDKARERRQYEIANKLRRTGIIGNVYDLLSLERSIRLADSIFKNGAAKQLAATMAYYKTMTTYLMCPLDSAGLKFFTDRVHIPYFRNRILKLNNNYIQLAKEKNPQFAASLQEIAIPEDLRNKADSLLANIFAPHKGKVIYMDIWGTWCGPCREEMNYVKNIKEQLNGKDVVFMYLANRSPRQTWENFIKEKEIYGENIAHFNLLEEQQQLIETRLGVNSYPRFFLIDKTGKIAVTDAPRPSSGNKLIKAIEKLLND